MSTGEEGSIVRYRKSVREVRTQHGGEPKQAEKAGPVDTAVRGTWGARFLLRETETGGSRQMWKESTGSELGEKEKGRSIGGARGYLTEPKCRMVVG